MSRTPEPEPTNDPWIGRTMAGKYRLDQRLGEGGFGTAYLAADLNYRALMEEERLVVVKVPHLDRTGSGGALPKDFRKEAHALTRLGHAHIVTVLDVGTQSVQHLGQDRDVPFLVLQYASGKSLADRLADGATQSIEDVIEWLPDIAKALDYLHSRRPPVLHRDVKPGNILFDDAGSALLADFGIAKVFGTSSTTGGLSGSPLYMAPDPMLVPEVAGQDALDHRYDQYALAVTVYEALSARFPHEPSAWAHGRTSAMDEHSASRLVYRKTTEPPVALVVRAPQVPPAVSDVLARALSMRRDDRFASCREFATRLVAAASSSTATRSGAPPPKPAPPPPKPTPPPAPPPAHAGDRPSGETYVGSHRGGSADAPRTTFLAGWAEPVGTERAPASDLPRRVRRTADGMEMVLIPAGVFWMGAVIGDSSALDVEMPRHAVTLSNPYYLDVNPVTIGAWKRFVAARRGRMPDDLLTEVETYPMHAIDHTEAVAYARWAGAELPTEAQWERAARGGRDGLVFPWGMKDDGKRRHGAPLDGGFSGLATVRSCEANDYGLYDMIGNVWEWCSDWYDPKYYSRSISRDPLGPAVGTARVVRGGSWNSHSGVYMRASHRNSFSPDRRSNILGFRLAKTVT